LFVIFVARRSDGMAIYIHMWYHSCRVMWGTLALLSLPQTHAAAACHVARRELGRCGCFVCARERGAERCCCRHSSLVLTCVWAYVWIFLVNSIQADVVRDYAPRILLPTRLMPVRVCAHIFLGATTTTAVELRTTGYHSIHNIQT
jgi:hypothetical protein